MRCSERRRVSSWCLVLKPLSQSLLGEPAWPAVPRVRARTAYDVKRSAVSAQPGGSADHAVPEHGARPCRIATFRETCTWCQRQHRSLFRRGTLKMNARVLLVCGSMLLISACKKGATTAAPPAPTVQVAEVLQQDVPIYREWVGT